WLAVMLGGYAVAALATVDECSYSKDIIELALERTRIMAGHVGDDGAWEEGPFYWGGIAFLLMFFHIIDSLPRSSTGLMKMDRLEKTALFPIYMNMPPCGRANFSDAHYYQDHNASYLFSLMAASCKNTYYQWAFHEFREVAPESIPELKKIEINDFRSPEETFQFLVYDQNVNPHPPDLPLFKVFQGKAYGFLASRSGFGRSDTGLVICANGGTNGTNHHQLDIGQIIMAYNRFNFISDPGYGRAFFLPDGSKINRQNYFAKSSMGHNIVTINGNNQIDSPEARGIIRNCVSNNAMDLFEIEMSSAYSQCSFAVRMVKRLKKADVVEIDDYFNLDSALPIRLAWFYRGHAEIIDGSTVKITSAAGICRLTIDSDVEFRLSSDSYSEKGFMDRNNQPLPPEEYPFIKIEAMPSKKHHLKTTFYFS
ncbi:MAG: heparinase II/III family protein, partial [Clostridia bacterium]|nr:heparinase II/III family protein [Clostridia bacterium]